MKSQLFLALFLCTILHAQQEIGDFASIEPTSQTTDFVIPSSHVFQKIISTGDPLSEGGVLPTNNDFTAYVPIGGSSELGYLSINSEAAPGGVTILDINFDPTGKLWETTRSEAVDFSPVAITAANCSGTVTDWNTVISCEEVVVTTDLNLDGHNDIGWCIEIDPATKTVIDKLWEMGNFAHENVVIHNNQRTVYQGADSNPGYLYKFVADTAQDLSSGSLYVYNGSKNGSGNWILLDNKTPAERNSTLSQSAAVGATVFNGIEDVEIGSDGLVYFAVKGEDRVYRFQDSDPLTGTTVPSMETYVGNAVYTITHENGSSQVNWGGGNDNLAFDGEGNLWVFQDGGNHYIWLVKNGHTQLNPQVEIFGSAPIGSEPTGITFTPDYRFLFMSIQHPSGTNNSSIQTDIAGQPVGFDRSTSLVIARKENMGTLWYLDSDGDGFAVPETVASFSSPGPGYTTQVLPLTDCDDSDPLINPNTIWYIDADGDGFANPLTIISCTSPGNGYTTDALPITDCNDNNPDINPDTIWYLDADGDGFADPSTVTSCTSPGSGYTTTVLPTTDCDDNDPIINPDTVWYLDADGDGFADPATISSCSSPGNNYTSNVLPATDCDDSNPDINPDTIWYLDFDGDGFADPATITSCNSPGSAYSTVELPLTDCDDNDAEINPDTIWYLDADGDGFALPPTISGCNNPGSGYIPSALPLTDCDDTDPTINPDTVWYLDADEDGFAHPDVVSGCESPGSGYGTTELPTTDCDDNDPDINDNVQQWFIDQDGDGYASPETVTSCSRPGPDYTNEPIPATDCNDNNAAINPGSQWYLDADEDGYAHPAIITSCENPGDGYTLEELPATDCDDNDPEVTDALLEWFLDADGDGYAATEIVLSCVNPGVGYTSSELPNTDCDDSDASANPETIWYLDEDRDGFADGPTIVSCNSPGTAYTTEVLPFEDPDSDNILYPNPTQGLVTISLDESYARLEITLLNASEKMILKREFENVREFNLDLTAHSSGVYYLQIQSNRGRVAVIPLIIL